MAGHRSIIARSLLSRIPQSERVAAVKDAVGSLDQGDSGEIDLAASLLAEQPDEEARQELVKHLRSVIENGHVDRVLPACARDKVLGNDLLEEVVRRIVDMVHSLQANPEGDIAVNMKDVVLLNENTVFSSVNADADAVASLFSAIRPLLGFVKRAVSVKDSERLPQALLPATLVCLGVSDRETCLTSRDVLVSILIRGDHCDEADCILLWSCIRKLILHETSSFHQGLGYSIWLHWATRLVVPSTILSEDQYWQMLRQGLQYGDGERLKQCLGMLRRSVALVLEEKPLWHLICSSEDASLGKQPPPLAKHSLSCQTLAYALQALQPTQAGIHT